MATTEYPAPCPGATWTLLTPSELAVFAIATEALAAGGAIIKPGDLLGPGDAASLLGVNRTTVSRWNREGYMPKPLQELGGVPVWTRGVIVAFAAEHRRRADVAGRRPLGTAAR